VQGGTDEGAATALGLQETEQFQLVVAFFTVSGAITSCSLSSRWEVAFPSLETPYCDRVGDLPHNLAIDRKLVGGLDE